jgi:hypothetical protein
LEYYILLVTCKAVVLPVVTGEISEERETDKYGTNLHAARENIEFIRIFAFTQLRSEGVNE